MTYQQRVFDHVRMHLEEAASLLVADARNSSICSLIDEAVELILEAAYHTDSRPEFRVIDGGRRVSDITFRRNAERP